MGIAADLATGLDPVRLARAAGIEPDAWQTLVLRSTAPRMLLNCCRQSGKSTTVSLLALHGALYEPGSLTLLLSPSLRQSSELFRKVLDAYRALDRPIPAEAESVLRLELENGSRIISLPGSEHSIRGFSKVRRLIIDEASRVDDALFYALTPMLAVSGGQLIALSTPWGKQGWWFHAWEDGDVTWERVLVTAPECPRISAKFLEEWRRVMPANRFAQEYLGQFAETDDAVFSYEQVQRALSTLVQPLFPGGFDAR